jgi:hypothetical protein
MTPKRPIDLLRDSAISMEIAGDGDDSAVSEMISLGDTLYIVKGHSIHAVQLADQIDPDRTNIATPNTHQCVLTVGGADPIVARTLLTAHSLFKKAFLGDSFDEEKGLKLVLELLRSIVTMGDTLAALETAEAQARASFETRQRQRNGLRLPTIINIKARCEAFAQKAGHVINTLEEIAKLFYAEELARKWIDSLAALTKKHYGKDSPFAEYMEGARPFLLFVLGMRNMIEHPAPERQIRVNDFRLLASGQIAPPAVEILQPGEEATTVTITLLMKQVIDNIVSVSELLMAHLCGARAESFAGIPVQVVELPVEQRSNKNQRIYYGCYMGEQLCRIG